MSLPDDLLELPAPAGARRVALHFLDEAAAAYPRVERDDDPEGLHDFRVGLRRLRSAIRSYDRELHGALSRKLRDRLRDVARATGGARDAEVHAAWLAEQLESLGSEERAGADHLAARLTRARRRAEAELADEALGRFPRLRRKLAAALGTYTLTFDVERPAPPATFATATAELLDRLAAQLERHLGAVSTIADQEEAHEARIAGKRLRYAVEPFAESVEGGRALVKQLKRMQDALGDLHDAHVFAGELTAAIAEVEKQAAKAADRRLSECGGVAESPEAAAAGAEPDPLPGLRALERRLRDREAAAFAEAEAWLGGRAVGLLTDVWRFAQRLAEQGASQVEIERKYLLRALPPEAAHVRPKEIDQGYLPGARLVERVRRVREHGRERYFRTVKLGSGVQRVEVEEETTREVFDALWPLTEGRRVRKRRHVVPHGDVEWEIDEFADRELVLAEVELDDAGQRVEFPPWAEAFVVRDVTDDPAYLNARLAR